MSDEYLLGLEITYTHFRVALFNVTQQDARLPIPSQVRHFKNKGYNVNRIDISDAFAQEISDYSVQYVNDLNIRSEDILGIGIAIAAQFRDSIPTNTSVGNLPMFLNQQFTAARIAQLNRSTMSAWYEYHFGVRQGNQNITNLTYVTVSRNINIGNIVNGAPNTAAVGQSIPHMEIGEAFLQQHTIDIGMIKSCTICGKPLCLTNLASGQALADQIFEIIDHGNPTQVVDEMNARNAQNRNGDYDRGGIREFAAGHRSGLSSVDAKAVVEAANQDDAEAMAIIRRQEIALTYALASDNMQNIGTQLIVIGGTSSGALNIDKIQRLVGIEGRFIPICQTERIGYTAILGATLYTK